MYIFKLLGRNQVSDFTMFSSSNIFADILDFSSSYIDATTCALVSEPHFDVFIKIASLLIMEVHA